jgi:hypothetical protein
VLNGWRPDGIRLHANPLDSRKFLLFHAGVRRYWKSYTKPPDPCQGRPGMTPHAIQ